MKTPRRAAALSELAPKALGPAVARQGFAGAEIVARWATIVGPEIAACSVPVKLSAPPRGQAPDPDAPPPLSTLLIRVEGAFALEVQHRTPDILARVNAHLGWACVGALRLRQGPISGFKRTRRAEPEPPPPATPEEEARVRAASSRVEEPALAEALDRLGKAVLARRRVTRA
ncbi:DUF721 domain-containing protein [Methylopila turkensis]|uniref:DUF721 domain-containing protein n=1 Tax=Methylopila turkensis TaxID=1437816 RepID=A0A9W6JRA5_9HYPH|nr:DciA family protein [Methylopila turkensis]GLK80344.1 hypothetical protein GCM10008174_20850 [Methylopila turkensis]